MEPPEVDSSQLVAGETVENQLHGLSYKQLETIRASRWVIKNKRKPPEEFVREHQVFKDLGDDEDTSSHVTSTSMAGATQYQPQ